MRAELSIVGQYADSLNLPLSESVLERLDRYLSLLLEWGTRINLVGSTSARAVIVDHLCDAVAVVARTTIPPSVLAVDVGSGAGLPGIPIALMRPDLRLTLVDAMRKRIAFLEHVRNELVGDWDIIWGRAESLALDSSHRERYAVAFERALAPMERSARLVLPFVSVGGRAIFMKGPTVSHEFIANPNLEDDIAILGGAVPIFLTYSLPDEPGRVRTIVEVRRITLFNPRVVIHYLAIPTSEETHYPFAKQPKVESWEESLRS